MLSEAKKDLLKDLNVSMSLRAPQKDALTMFAQVLDLLKWQKTPWVTDKERNTKQGQTPKYTAEEIAAIDKAHYADLAAQLDRVHAGFMTVTSFEREFPSLTFALATGVGKTRLMAACMAYLHRVKKVNNFFVIAPNRTIYDKLKKDFSLQYPDKYVFSGCADFAVQPNIIDGDSFNSFNPAQQRLEAPELSTITIHIFNIAKLTHGRGKETEIARVMRLHEVLGESYFEYLRSLPDLCVMMDESHHYHAEQGFGVINDLNPMIGVEFTATPQIQKGAKKTLFKNVVYEYSLAHALNNEMYVKEPVVWTRKDFDASQYNGREELLDKEKLVDGIRLHEDTKMRLDEYGRRHGVRVVKPFVLVVAKNIAHSNSIREFLTSTDFYGGYYADKVLEINSKQGAVESEENTELLLSLENPDNKIEIVLHVDKLKEGWDVKNLYTIIPLRASASDTLTEQTIGRGLRLPYGERTGDPVVDRLAIVCHDKFSDIIAEANKPDSLVRRVYTIDPSLLVETAGNETETVAITPTYQAKTENLTAELAEVITVSASVTEDVKTDIARFVAEVAAATVVQSSRYYRNIGDVRKDDEIRASLNKAIVRQTTERFQGITLDVEEIAAVVAKAVEYCAEALTDNIIPIPEVVINPQDVAVYRFYDFTLDVRTLRPQPSSEQIVGQELREGGESIDFEGEYLDVLPKPKDTAENQVAKYIVLKDNIDYGKCAALIFKLIAEAKTHFLSYLSEEDTERLMRQQSRFIADYIYAQMNEHFEESELVYSATEIRPFQEICGCFGSKVKSDDVYDYNVTVKRGEVPSKVFKGFKKACHTLYKFDSYPELEFARLCEREKAVQKWLRPAPKQFDIYWGKHRQKYEPDFVVETADKIYMVEVKAQSEVSAQDVQEKGKAGAEYCRKVSGWNEENGGKPWEYALIADTSIQANSSFEYVISGRSPLEMLLEQGGE